MKYGTVNSLQSPRFSGIRTFMRMENVRASEDIDFAVVGIPFDTCATYRSGARFGPSAIREASALAAKPYHPELEVDIFEHCSGVDWGDVGSWIYRCAESACPVFWKSPVRTEEITVPDR